MSDAREGVERALARALFDIEDGNITNWMMGALNRERYRSKAATILAALDAAGWAVVPSIETPEMIHAGRKRLRVLLKGAPDLYTDGEVNDLAMGAYGHMLAARPR